MYRKVFIIGIGRPIMKIMLIAVAFAILGLFLISGCGETVVCSSPAKIINGICCLDADSDGKCDTMAYRPEKHLEKGAEEVKGPEETAPLKPVVQQDVKKEVPEVSEGQLLFADRITRGTGPVNIVEFGDYFDQYTSRWHVEVLQPLLVEYGNYVTYIFRPYPHYKYQHSRTAAEAFYCANEQNAAWKMHDLIMSSKALYLSLNDIQNMAGELELDSDRFRICLTEKTYGSYVQEDIDAGKKFGVSDTPTFFVNGKRIAGYRPLNYFEEILAPYIPADKTTSRIASASGTGNAFLIHEGEAALDSSVKLSQYSNEISSVQGSFSLTAGDMGKEGNDSAIFSAYFTLKDYKTHVFEKYQIKLTKLDTKFSGGVMMDMDVHGSTGIGTALLPRTHAYVVVSGFADVYRDNMLALKDQEMQFFLVDGSRVNGIQQNIVQAGDHEAYLFLPGKHSSSGTAYPFSPDGFLHVFWEDLSLSKG